MTKNSCRIFVEFLVFQSHESEHEMNTQEIKKKEVDFYFLFLVSA